MDEFRYQMSRHIHQACDNRWRPLAKKMSFLGILIGTAHGHERNVALLRNLYPT
jgi:hypothetical protein